MNLDFSLRRLGLNHQSKILNITHANCFDGSCASIVLENIFKNIQFQPETYSNIDSTVQKLIESSNLQGYDFVFITDISPNNPELLKNQPRIILLDHHQTALQHQNASENKYCIPDKFSGSSLTKKFVEEYFKTPLKHLDDLIYLSADYDLWHKKNDKSTFLNELHFFYWGDAFKKRFYNGDTRFTKEEIKYLRERKNLFKNVYENLDLFELNKISGVYTESGNFLNEICEKLIKEKYQIVFCKNPSKGSISVRCKKGFVNIGIVLKTLGFGGGHEEAGAFLESDFMKMKEKIEAIENYIFEELKRKK